MREINVALIGQGFMGRSHSNAWGQVAKFFKPPVRPVMHTVFGQPEENPQVFADNWGWKNASTDWRALVRSPEIGLVDVVTPNYMHAPVAKAAIAAGKPVACEKPIAGTLADAREMVEAAKTAKVKTFVWFNYRRCPAVALAHQLVKDGQLGTIRHVRAVYLQDWADESVPLLWRFEKKLAGSGAHGDLNAHIIDMTRFVTGQEITEIAGAIAETFIKERTLIDGRGRRRHRRGRAGRRGQGQGDRRRHRAVPGPLLRRRRGQLRGRPPGHRQPEPQRLRDQRHQGLAEVRLRADERAAVLRRHAAPRRAGLDHDHVYPRRRPSLRGQLVARRPHHRLRARLHQPGLRHPPGARRRGADRADPRLRGRLPDAARAGSRPDPRPSDGRSR